MIVCYKAKGAKSGCLQPNFLTYLYFSMILIVCAIAILTTKVYGACSVFSFTPFLGIVCMFMVTPFFIYIFYFVQRVMVFLVPGAVANVKLLA